MTLEEAKTKFEGKLCNINWANPGDRPNAAVPLPTKNVVVTEVFEMFDHRIMFRCKDKIYMPFEIWRLELV